MRYWVYKCNASNPDYAGAWGDWDVVFDKGRRMRWGATTLCGVERLSVGDILLAHQSDRNELVGTVRVDNILTRDGVERIYVSPIERIGIKVRPLKKADPKIDAIPALQGGPIMTAYDISTADAKRLLKAAGATVIPTGAKSIVPANGKPPARTPARQFGAGFGTPEKNQRVEKAAIDIVTEHYESRGFKVVDRQRDNVGYDLECIKGKKSLHVEVKGISGGHLEFIITKNERKRWQEDPAFVLVAVTNALSVAPKKHFLNRKGSYDSFRFAGISFRASSIKNER